MELSHEECGYTITVAEGRVSKDDGRGGVVKLAWQGIQAAMEGGDGGGS